MESKAYQFTAESSRDKMPLLSSKICGIIDGFPVDYAQQVTLVLGKLKGLFGQPLYETENFEEQYSYCVRAQSEDGETVYLEAYSGSSGPSIGGDQSAASHAAAAALVEYIRQAAPADYDYVGYYMDGPSTVRMGVKEGVPYYEEGPLELSEQEFTALFRRLYGLDEE